MYRLQTHMDQKLQAFCRTQAIRMLCVRHGNDLAVHRTEQFSLGRDHCHAIPNNFLGKYRIRNLAKSHSLSCHRRKNLAALHKNIPLMFFLTGPAPCAVLYLQDCLRN